MTRRSDHDLGPGLFPELDRPAERAPGSPPAPGLPPPASAGAAAPLAERMRPATLDAVVGQSHLLGPGKLLTEMLAAGRPHSLLLWGPPGSGKTTLARALASAFDLPIAMLSAVLSGVKDLREVVDRAERHLRAGGKPTLVFVDEIHRFNKAQQDALLPHVERGTIVLVGATTENPSFEVIAPLLSRTRVLVLEPLSNGDLTALSRRALGDTEHGLGGLGLTIGDEALGLIAEQAQGDARRALGALEVAAELAERTPEREILPAHVAEATQRRMLRYDRAGDEHYDVISAFIKSMRGSDPDAALYWLVRMLEAGEDPLFIARRMVVFAAEDVGNADPAALGVALSVKDAVHFVGLPEGRIPLAHGVAYLACAPKSNAAYAALGRVTEEVRRSGSLPVPLHLRNAPTGLMQALGHGAGYEYPHDAPGHHVAADYLPTALVGHRYFQPSDQGAERASGERLAHWREAVARARTKQR